MVDLRPHDKDNEGQQGNKGYNEKGFVMKRPIYHRGELWDGKQNRLLSVYSAAPTFSAESARGVIGFITLSS